MTTKDLISMLQKLDPSGEADVSMLYWFSSGREGFYDTDWLSRVILDLKDSKIILVREEDEDYDDKADIS